MTLLIIIKTARNFMRVKVIPIDGKWEWNFTFFIQILHTKQSSTRFIFMLNVSKLIPQIPSFIDQFAIFIRQITKFISNKNNVSILIFVKVTNNVMLIEVQVFRIRRFDGYLVSCLIVFILFINDV